MKRHILLLTLLVISLAVQSQNFSWARNFSGTSWIQGNANTVDVSGFVYTTGEFQGTLDFDPGPGAHTITSANGKDVFVSKMDAFGNFVWALNFPAAGYELATSITADHYGNVYVTGYFQGTMDFDPGAGTYIRMTHGDYDVF